MFSKFHRSQICRDKIRRSDIMTCVGSSQGWSIMVQATWSPTVQPCQPHGFGTLQEKLVNYCISCYIILYIHDYPLLSMNDYPLLSIVIHYYPLLPPKLSTSFHDYPFISRVLPIISRWMNLMSSWSMCSQSFRSNYENKAISFVPGLPCVAVHLRLVLKCGLPVYSNLW